MLHNPTPPPPPPPSLSLSQVQLPYRGWTNQRVVEEVGRGHRLARPQGCPDEVYRIMLDCWARNAKRRSTFPRINRAMLEAWKSIAEEKVSLLWECICE